MTDKEKQENFKKFEKELLENTISEAKELGKTDSISLIEEVINGKAYKKPDGETQPNVLVDKVVPKKTKAKFEPQPNDSDIDKYLESYSDELDELEQYDIPYDLVTLPSKGLIYKNGKEKVAVSYVTAADEDLITSPNLYMDDRVIDFLLRRKILDKNIKPEDLCSGDRDTIVIWLRINAYGENFPVTAKDPITGTEFDVEVDLSKLKLNEFKLTPDENGLMDFKTPKTKDLIKFKFLSYKDELGYKKIIERSTPKIRKISLENSKDTIENIIKSDKTIDQEIKKSVQGLLKSIDDYIDSIVDTDGAYLRSVTYLMNKLIVSINGNKDREYINQYIHTMPAMEAMAFRRYVTTNTPSVDYKVTIDRPESLGGGSFDTFLEFDSTIFINVPE